MILFYCSYQSLIIFRGESEKRIAAELTRQTVDASVYDDVFVLHLSNRSDRLLTVLLLLFLFLRHSLKLNWMCKVACHHLVHLSVLFQLSSFLKQ